jgi:hypothetical protein
MNTAGNNPGSLRKHGAIQFVGEATITTNPPYREFYEYIFGVRAIFSQLNILREGGISNLKDLITHWYPLTRDELVQAIEFISQNTKIAPDKLLYLMDRNELIIIACGLIHFNTGKIPSETAVTEVYELFISNKIK